MKLIRHYTAEGEMILLLKDSNGETIRVELEEEEGFESPYPYDQFVYKYRYIRKLLNEMDGPVFKGSQKVSNDPDAGERVLSGALNADLVDFIRKQQFKGE